MGFEYDINGEFRSVDRHNTMAAHKLSVITPTDINGIKRIYSTYDGSWSSEYIGGLSRTSRQAFSCSSPISLSPTTISR